MIPHLSTLCFGGNRFGVAPEFAETYVKIHACLGRDGWGLATISLPWLLVQAATCNDTE